MRTKKQFASLALVIVVALLSWACQQEQPAPAPQVLQPPTQAPPIAPPVQPVVQPQAPPPTPLIPIADGTAAAAPTGGGSSKKPGGGSDGIDKAIPGAETSGDELVGNYSCNLDADGLPTGLFKLPAFGCRIFKAGDGKLKVGSVSRSATSISGTVSKPSEGGFFIVGKFSFPGNAMNIKARMAKKGGGAKPKFTGRGRGKLNDKTAVKYTLTMTRK